MTRLLLGFTAVYAAVDAAVFATGGAYWGCLILVFPVSAGALAVWSWRRGW